jgi:hypothetical protein
MCLVLPVLIVGEQNRCKSRFLQIFSTEQEGQKNIERRYDPLLLPIHPDSVSWSTPTNCQINGEV